METGILKTPVKHVYQEINQGKHKTTKHFLLQEVTNGNSLLTEKLNVSQNRGFAKSDPDYWLHTRPVNKWERITGLFYNKQFDLYKGDKGKNNQKEDLIIVKFNKLSDSLTIYYFKGYYTNDLNKIIHLID